MTYQALAFFTGLFGSIHCVAMCGPLLLALPFAKQSPLIALFQNLLYQSGRILIYSFLGFLAGLLGIGFAMLGLQQALALLTGTILLIAGLSSYFPGRWDKSFFGTKVISIIGPFLSRYMSKPYGAFVAGMFNGILPCGITYIAIAQSVNQSSALSAAESMFFFGLGTLPLLLITAVAPLAFKRLKAFRMLVPVLLLIAGSVLLARGFNVSIPYVSHAIASETAPQCN
ncbi:sulfite exporter TauE/SafE family protein [Desertivirga xinjiangensis]|uniref:sulfite exporter TauE/SafE family protein n=1 Tax=Desertivirga xinjiangensis TaxID=539206 RepID=UPI00210DBD24|nr:sulfite exporter TauE/SafE family protein [Pedobacter xinjiangensis]